MPDHKTDLHWLALACDLAERCPPSSTAFSVGAVIVDAHGQELARAHSRETDPKSHAEESALLKLRQQLQAPTPPSHPPNDTTPAHNPTDHPSPSPADHAKPSQPPEATSQVPGGPDNRSGSSHPTESTPQVAGDTEDGGLEALLAGATIYSSLEPCGQRLSRPKSCAQLIVEAGIRRVVYGWREPSLFVPGDGDELLRAAGVEVVEFGELAERAVRPNRHLLG
jgi:diaminohydroxyphosphoribosylaminopyrimidine deaminase / 5-amino-6-(5-phosphoribosylamino)uracil reductase